MGPQQRLDLLARPAAEKRQPIADRGIFGAGAGVFLATGLSTGDAVAAVEHRTIDDDEPRIRPQHPEPFVDRRFGMRQGPQHMAADHQVEARRRKRQLLGIGLLETHGQAAVGCLALGASDHRRREVDAGHAVPARRELQTEKTGAGAHVERVQCALRPQDEPEDAIPRRVLGRRADAVAEILVEMRRPPVPMGGDLLFDRIGMQ